MPTENYLANKLERFKEVTKKEVGYLHPDFASRAITGVDSPTDRDLELIAELITYMYNKDQYITLAEWVGQQVNRYAHPENARQAARAGKLPGAVRVGNTWYVPRYLMHGKRYDQVPS